jgi:hypothetical protein
MTYQLGRSTLYDIVGHIAKFHDNAVNMLLSHTATTRLIV